MNVPASAVEKSEHETGPELLTRILIKRRRNWQGRGEYTEPVPADPASLSPLPEGWAWSRLEQLGFIFGGLTKHPKRDRLPKQLPYLRVANVYANELRLQDIEYIGVEDSELAKLLVQVGDLLVVEGNGSKDQIGRLAVWNGSIDPCVHQNHLIKVRPVESRMSKWILHWLQSPNGRHFVELVASSTSGLYTLSVNKVGALPVPLAPLCEQRQIVAEIEKQFTRLEAGVAALRRVQANLKRYRASVLKAACEGRLVPTEAELARTGTHKATFESGEALLGRILTDRRKNWQGRGKYKEPAAPDAGKHGPLPAGWTWATFEQIAERVTVGFVGSMKHEYVEDGVPFLRSQNVRENRFDPEGLLHISHEFHQQLSKSSLQPGDLAVVRSGSVGVTCVIPESLPDANCSDLVLIQRPLAFVPQYGAYYMNSLAKRHVEAGKVGVALIHFNTKSVAALAVPLPPLAEQKRIVAEAERRLSVVDELDAVVSANLQRATRLRQSILQKAFTGKLT